MNLWSLNLSFSSKSQSSWNLPLIITFIKLHFWHFFSAFSDFVNFNLMCFFFLSCPSFLEVLVLSSFQLAYILQLQRLLFPICRMIDRWSFMNDSILLFLRSAVKWNKFWVISGTFYKVKQFVRVLLPPSTARQNWARSRSRSVGGGVSAENWTSCVVQTSVLLPCMVQHISQFFKQPVSVLNRNHRTCCFTSAGRKKLKFCFVFLILTFK